MLSTRSSRYNRVTKQRKADERRRMCVFSVGCLCTLLALVYVALGIRFTMSTGQRSEPGVRGRGSILDMVGLSKAAAVPTEKPPPALVTGAEGTTWTGAWRAASEPGGVYMGGGVPLEQTKVPAFKGSTHEAQEAGYYTTPNGDSVAVHATLDHCRDYVERIAGGMTAREATEGRYPIDEPITDLLRNWPPDLISVPQRHYATLCRFDFTVVAERTAAQKFREDELPFIVVNNPEAGEIARQWSTPGHLEKRLGLWRSYVVERSDDNHFMYYSQGRGKMKEWTPPTVDIRMTYTKWLETALNAYNTSVVEPHYYFRVSPPDTTAADLPIFDAAKPSMFVPYPKLSKGAHCRFGAAGIVAEAHYDGSRNFIAELGGPPSHPNSGRRRYVMAAPKDCGNAYLLPKGHPSGRHSEIDWSRPVDTEKFPKWAEMRAFEMILEPGNILYIPHFWIHYVQSLGTNFQCNARSGHSLFGSEPIKQCGFL